MGRPSVPWTSAAILMAGKSNAILGSDSQYKSVYSVGPLVVRVSSLV